jgi:hypothetical protein
LNGNADPLSAADPSGALQEIYLRRRYEATSLLDWEIHEKLSVELPLSSHLPAELRI